MIVVLLTEDSQVTFQSMHSKVLTFCEGQCNANYKKGKVFFLMSSLCEKIYIALTKNLKKEVDYSKIPLV